MNELTTGAWFFPKRTASHAKKRKKLWGSYPVYFDGVLLLRAVWMVDRPSRESTRWTLHLKPVGRGLPRVLYFGELQMDREPREYLKGLAVPYAAGRVEGEGWVWTRDDEGMGSLDPETLAQLGVVAYTEPEYFGNLEKFHKGDADGRGT